MEDKQLHQNKKTKTRKSGFLTSCFTCTSSKEDEDAPYTIQSSPTLDTKGETVSSYIIATPQVEEDNKPEEDAPAPPPPEPKPAIEKEYKDHLIRTILNKYLEAKKEAALKKETEEKLNEGQTKPESPRKQDFLCVECYSSDSFETLVLGNESSKPRGDFPTKSKSAPTTSTAHDSLADICSKMSRFKQENKSSESYITCCSDDTNATKKKLELIFNHSSEEISSCLEDNSVASLKYEISCEGSPVAVGSLRPQGRSETVKYTNQKLFLRPTAKGEIGGGNGSTGSLKWKLIISHHDHGDFP